MKKSASRKGLFGKAWRLGTGRRGRAHDLPEPWQPNPWIRVGSDDSITVVIDRSEMGQGALTGLAMLVAEELEVDLARIRTEFAPAARAYRNAIFGEQTTGGSTSIRAAWNPLRQAAALTRVRFIRAAAKTWGVDPEECRAENGEVIHDASGRRLRYGALIQTAGRLRTPGEVPLKSPDAFRVIGRPHPRLDLSAKVDGSAIYGWDVRVPGQFVALVARCPVFGGWLDDFDATEAKKITAVRDVVAIDSGVAVIADAFWPTFRARELLYIRWQEGPLKELDDATIRQRLEAAAAHAGAVQRREGQVEHALARASRRFTAVYELPYVAHTPPEPMSCTAHVQPGQCDLWVPTQSQDGAQKTAARLLHLPLEAVRVHSTLLGGAFGRRLEQDFVAEAVQIAQVAGVPVQTLWTRDDDVRHDYYRPASYNVLAGGIDSDGYPIAWSHRIVGPGATADGAKNLPYAIPHIRIETVEEDPGIPTGAWRSVGHSQNAFVVESFLDELAHAGGHDPFVLRHHLLRGLPRHIAVLDLAAGKAGWGKPLPPRRAMGLAFHASFGSLVAQVAEVSVEADGVRVHRVVCAIDCGIAVNPDLVCAQMEGSIAFGLSAALKGGINIAHGRVQQDRSDELRFEEMPAVEVYVVPSQEPPGGVGEPGVPPIAPAVCNAIFAATGQRVRRLPIRSALPSM